MSKQRADIQQAITDQVIARIEEGGLPPWECPWTKSGESALPYNWLTKKCYSGINIFILWMKAADMGYSTNAWLTFKQAQQLGGQVRKGEKSVKCIFFKPLEVDDDTDSTGSSEKQVVLCRRAFSLFNVEQVEGLESLPSLPEQPEYSDEKAVEAITEVAEKYCSNTGVQIRNGGDRAYYSPSLDIIKMPTTFHTGSGYAATLAHELVHSTGHRSRLNRFEQNQEALKGKKEAYAYEELIAETGAAFICAELSIQGEHEQHACYLDSWLKALKGDKTFLFKAAAAAGKAHNLLMRGGDTKALAEVA